MTSTQDTQASTPLTADQASELGLEATYQASQADTQQEASFQAYMSGATTYDPEVQAEHLSHLASLLSESLAARAAYERSWQPGMGYGPAEDPSADQASDLLAKVATLLSDMDCKGSMIMAMVEGALIDHGALAPS